MGKQRLLRFASTVLLDISSDGKDVLESVDGWRLETNIRHMYSLAQR